MLASELAERELAGSLVDLGAALRRAGRRVDARERLAGIGSRRELAGALELSRS